MSSKRFKILKRQAYLYSKTVGINLFAKNNNSVCSEHFIENILSFLKKTNSPKEVRIFGIKEQAFLEKIVNRNIIRPNQEIISKIFQDVVNKKTMSEKKLLFFINHFCSLSNSDIKSCNTTGLTYTRITVNKNGTKINQLFREYLEFHKFFDLHSTNKGNSVYLHQVIAFFYSGGKNILDQGFSIEKYSTETKLGHEIHHLDSNPKNNCSKNLCYIPSTGHKIVTNISRGFNKRLTYKNLKVSFSFTNQLEFEEAQFFDYKGKAVTNNYAFFAKLTADTLKKTINFIGTKERIFKSRLRNNNKAAEFLTVQIKKAMKQPEFFESENNWFAEIAKYFINNSVPEYYNDFIVKINSIVDENINYVRDNIFHTQNLGHLFYFVAWKESIDFKFIDSLLALLNKNSICGDNFKYSTVINKNSADYISFEKYDALLKNSLSKNYDNLVLILKEFLDKGISFSERMNKVECRKALIAAKTHLESVLAEKTPSTI
jgi:hypothetical protein